MPDTYAHFETMTKLDDRTSESITRDEIERIAIGRTRVRPFDQERSRWGGRGRDNSGSGSSPARRMADELKAKSGRTLPW